MELLKNVYCLLTSLVNASSRTKSASLSNQKYKIKPALINLHRNEYTQELHYYQFTVKLDRRIGNFNTLNSLSNKVCIPNKIEDLNIYDFNMISGKKTSYMWKKDYI